MAAPTTVGQLTELRTYSTRKDGERRVLGQRVNGSVRVVDKPPAGQPGRSYLIARRVESLAELDALLEDYVAQGERFDAIPMRVHW